MQIAIVGLAGSGKTTVFNTLTRGHAETGGYGGVTLNVGVVKVPDDRLDRLAEVFKPRKIVHAAARALFYTGTGSRLRHKYHVATVRQGSQFAATSRASLRETGSPEK